MTRAQGAGPVAAYAAPPQLRCHHAAAYAMGGIVDGILFSLLNLFLLFYITTTTDIPAPVAGTALAIAIIGDAIATPFIGALSDNLRSRFGRRLPFMAAALPLAVGSVLALFSLPGVADLPALVLLTLLAFAARVGMAMFQLPHVALGTELTAGYAERSSLFGWRWGCSVSGGMMVTMLAFGWQLAGRDLTDPAAYRSLVLALTAAIVLGGVFACAAAWLTLPRQQALHPRRMAPALPWVAARELFRSANYRRLFIGSGLFFVGFALANVLNLYAKIHFWNLSSRQIAIIFAAYSGGLLLAAGVAPAFARLLEKRTIVMLGFGGLATTQALPVVLRLSGGLPLTGGALAVLLAIFAMIGATLVGSGSIAWQSMIGDAADEHELLFGTRREGMYHGLTAFANKTATGLGTLIGGLSLEVSGLNPASASAPAEEVGWTIGLFYGPVAGGLSLLALVPLLFYRINRARHDSICRDLALRNRRDGPA